MKIYAKWAILTAIAVAGTACSNRQHPVDVADGIDGEEIASATDSAIPSQKSYATADGMTMKIVAPDPIKVPVDSLVVEFTNSREVDGMTGEWFCIEKQSAEGSWQELPYDRTKENSDETLNIVFNAVGWIVFPDKPFRMTVNPWFYDRNWRPGTYRLVKTFSYPPYPIQKSDTAYVEFQIR